MVKVGLLLSLVAPVLDYGEQRAAQQQADDHGERDDATHLP